MRRSIMPLVVLFCFLSVSHLAEAQGENITIKSPSDGASIPERPIVEGVVMDKTGVEIRDTSYLFCPNKNAS